MQQISKDNLNITYFNKSIDYSLTYKCVFLDRDGVIIEDTGFPSEISKIKFVKGIFTTLTHLKKLGYLIGIVTNQSGIARGFFTIEKFISIQTQINKHLCDRGIDIDFVIACPYFKHGNPPYNIEHEFRKPLPGMINEVCRRIKIDKQNSFLVGDRITDIESAKKANLKKAFLLSDKSFEEKNFKNLSGDKFEITKIEKISEIIYQLDN